MLHLHQSKQHMVLKDVYDIDFLGPIKTCCKGSCRNLVNSLELPDQVGFVLTASLSSPINPYSEALQEVRKTLRGSYLIFNQNNPIRMYQFVDGMQNLVTTYNCAKLHHHCCVREQRFWISRYKKEHPETPMGFSCLTPRFYYRIYYNTCDEQNRSLRRVGTLHNTTLHGSHKIAQLVVDTAIDNLHKYLTSIGETNHNIITFCKKVLNSAVIYMLPSTKTEKYYNINSSSKDNMNIKCSKIMTKSLHLFHKTKVGLCRGHSKTAYSKIICLQCKMQAIVGCTICGKKFPNQVYCLYCGVEHVKKCH